MNLKISCDDMRLIVASIQELRDTLRTREQPEVKERLAELEIKMTKLWSVLTKENAQGETKVSKLGRRLFPSTQGMHSIR